jgi:hypothetical protein
MKPTGTESRKYQRGSLFLPSYTDCIIIVIDKIKMDSETIIYLLKGGRLNMEERKERGIWPHPPLLLQNIVDELFNYLQTHKWFPHEWVERKNGELIDDVAVIEKVNDKKVIYRARAASPYDLTIVTAKTEKTFKSVRVAAEYYLRNVLNLPGDLDSWKVVEK